jgi:hypothetical protein
MNNTALINSKNSTKYKDKETAEVFTFFYTPADHIPKLKERRKTYETHYRTKV